MLGIARRVADVVAEELPEVTTSVDAGEFVVAVPSIDAVGDEEEEGEFGEGETKADVVCEEDDDGDGDDVVCWEILLLVFVIESPEDDVTVSADDTAVAAVAAVVDSGAGAPEMNELDVAVV